ncbi:MAG: hypothetical protein KBD56_03080 [Candidatus Eisenbacteria bacterium]|nr:hypothetical protein [Candidatus Eisenbacteria bacterium]
MKIAGAKDPSGAPKFEARLVQAQGAWRRRAFLEGVSAWLGDAVPGLAVLLLLALFLPPARGWSAVMSALAALWIVATFARRLVVPHLRRGSLASYAQWLERRAGLRRNELGNALALERERGRWSGDPVSRDLVDIAIGRAGETLGSLPLDRLHQDRSLAPSALRAGLALLPVFVAFLLTPVRFGDALRLLTSAGGAGVIPAVEIQVSPGEERVDWGSPVAIEARVSGRRRPDSAEILMRGKDGAWMTAPMARVEETDHAGGMDRDGDRVGALAATAGSDRYAFSIGALEGDLEYRVRAQWAESDNYHLRVVHRLQAVGYRKELAPPEYTGLGVQRDLASTGDLAALTGSQVTLEALHRRAGIAGRLRFTDGSTVELEPAGEDALAGRWNAMSSGGYQVELYDPRDGSAWVSDTFRVETVPDLAPAVELQSPEQSIDMPSDMIVPLMVSGVDDFGLTELALIYGRPGEDPTRRVLATWKGAERRREARVEYAWDLSELTLLPGQEISYFLQVTDNDPIRGPKTGETALATVRFPTVAEMYANATEERREDIHSLEETVKNQEKLEKDLERVAREMLRDEGVTWERQQEVQALIERQNELGRKLGELQESLEQSRERMENQNLFSMEMMTKVREIQDLVNQIQSGELHQAIAQMQQALQQLDPEALRQAMERMKISQNEVSAALDRTLEMLKRLLAEEQLDQAMQKLDELAARQAEINRQMEEGARKDAQPSERSPAQGEKKEGSSEDDSEQKPLGAEESKSLQAEQQALEKELQDLKEMLQKIANQAGGDKQKLEESLKEMLKDRPAEKIQEQMAKMREAMEQMDRQLSLKFGRKIRSDLQMMSTSLSEMKKTIDLERMEQLTRALYDIAHRMVDVSQTQEGLVDAAQREEMRALAAREQQLLEEVGALRDSLAAVSRELPIVGFGQLRAMNETLLTTARAKDAFEQGSRGRGSTLAGESMRTMNAAIKALLETAAQATSSCASSCPNPFNRLQSMCQQQNSLNQDTQQAIGACSTPRPSMSQGEALSRLAARQEMIKQGMQELQAETQDSRGMLGDLESITKEMEEVARELRNRNADPRLIERQERILSRLLNAQRSLRKQDQSEERQSRTGIDPGPRVGPGAVDEGGVAVEQLERAMMRGSQDPVPAEYRRLVDAYLRALLKAR